MRTALGFITLLCIPITAFAAGDWPEPRHNPHLTASQPTPGAMTSAPAIVAQFDLGRSRPAVAPVPNDDTAELGLSLVAGAVHAYRPDGTRAWLSHPAGLNIQQIEAVDDLDGDGTREILAMAGRPTAPYGAGVLLSLEDGRVLWRYDVEPMSYAWYLYRGHFLPGVASQQIVVIMHAYPPDAKNGYIALFDFKEPGAPPEQRWRYDFSEYTCFPSFLQTDLEGDGAKELVIETHSRMWVLDAPTGAVKQFVKWDVSPANVRSYGLVRFVDLNGDALEDFLCIATFAQHHEVLLNKGGAYEEAWHYGWPESVTTGKVVTVHPDPPYADLDGDGALEIVVSMFNAEGESAWCTRVYDAATGAIELRIPGVAAVSLNDVNHDGRADLLANATTDPTRATLNGARVLTLRDGAATTLWEDATATAIDKKAETAFVRRGEEVFSLQWNDNAIALEPWEKQPKPAKQRFAAVPDVVGPPLPMILAADLLPGAGNEIILYSDPAVRVLQLRDGELVQTADYTSSSIPVPADMNGDGALDLVLSVIGPAAPPVVRVVTPAQENRVVWESTFPTLDRAGLPQPRTAYIRTIHLTGKPTPDLYVWAGTPIVRSAGLDGTTGTILWEKGEIPNKERYWGASVNYASAYDFNGDGNEDLVFTNPDYYCVADGPTGEFLLGPSFPPDIFSQPCQGLYTYPAILARTNERPWVALVAGHYFQALMTLDAQPAWYTIPVPGENRAAAEAFLKLDDGTWLMGFGRQNGNFACIDAATGSTRWEHPLDATASDAISGDVDGDGRFEFVVGTSHGYLIALGDDESKPRLVWTKHFDAGLGTPILADADGDGACEVAVATTDGHVYVCR